METTWEGGGFRGSESFKVLTLAVSEVQSLVPLGTLQLAIFNQWGC
jgi:hypothetical protein